MEYIKGHCTTNLDNYNVREVTEFYRVPNKGERISCTYRGTATTLKVVDITHDFRNQRPYIIIELHN